MWPTHVCAAAISRRGLSRRSNLSNQCHAISILRCDMCIQEIRLIDAAFDAEWLAYCKLNIYWYTRSSSCKYTQYCNYSLHSSSIKKFGGGGWRVAGQLADKPNRGLVNSRTGELTDCRVNSRIIGSNREYWGQHADCTICGGMWSGTYGREWPGYGRVKYIVLVFCPGVGYK